MMSDSIRCGPCDYADNNRNAVKWCTICEEGLCKECETVHKSIKTTRSHRLMSTDDFQQIKIFPSALPVKTMTSDLNYKAAENTKTSTALADLEETVIIALRSLQQIINNRTAALENLEGQKQTIKDTINNTRARIIQKLDDLEQKTLLELDTQHGKCNSEINKLLNCLKNSERDLNCLIEQTSQLKSFASEIQLFLGTRQISEAVFKEVESVKERIKSVPNYAIDLQLYPSIIALMNEVDQLGKISVKKTTTSLPFKEAKIDQAQIQLPVQETKSINNIKTRLRKRFNVNENVWCIWLSGCTMLSNVIDTGRIAVTYGGSKYVEIFNIKNNTVERKVEFDENCNGISYQDSKLFISSEGIVITDITGKVLKTLEVDCGLYLETTIDRIYYTVESDNAVHCISMTGKEIWEHKVESLVDPRGIAVDDHQNVFVADRGSNFLTVIQHDGSASKTLLTKLDNLYSPTALHYNKDKNILIVCNAYEGAALYNLQ
ncbi:unnamed protein product [Mytilus edulis]|uniref:B box-type domain-containing protein n=1 Tax=Mytilus edulis TaxID=6550 RepID=A0A8S3UBT1_MYTED|nr:unnamed protein product [Mytilus edulis]